MVDAAITVNAGTITISGAVIQSRLNGTGPAVNSPGLNAILDAKKFRPVFMFRVPFSVN